MAIPPVPTDIMLHILEINFYKNLTYIKTMPGCLSVVCISAIICGLHHLCCDKERNVKDINIHLNNNIQR